MQINYKEGLNNLKKKYEIDKKKIKQKLILEQSNIISNNIKIIAELLHKKLCKYNHTDGCGWHYDKGDWQEYSRKEYIKKAENLLSTQIDDQIIIKILDKL